jgi:hypothetical protein
LASIFSNYRVEVDNRKLDDYIKPFVEKPGFCKSDCTSCGYCDAYVKKHFDVDNRNKIKQTFDMATDFYLKFDQFINLVEKTDNEPDKVEKGAQPVKKLFENKSLERDMEFDF